jgi:hypothetical protein
MPSALVKNDEVEFICARDFLWEDHEYHMGEEFDQDIAIGRIEQLVRVRWIIPVVENAEVKPRMFHREVRLKSLVLERLGLDEKVPQFTGSVAPLEATPDADVDVVHESYDPADHTVDEVVTYVRSYPDSAASIYEMEEQGKNRSTLLSQLGDIINEEDIDV